MVAYSPSASRARMEGTSRAVQAISPDGPINQLGCARRLHAVWDLLARSVDASGEDVGPEVFREAGEPQESAAREARSYESPAPGDRVRVAPGALDPDRTGGVMVRDRRNAPPGGHRS